MSTHNENPPTQRIINETDFQANCTELIAEVYQTGQEIIITQYSVAVAKLVPYEMVPHEYETKAAPAKPATNPDPNPDPSQSTFGRYRDKIQIYGDIVSPMPAEWFADPADPEQEDLF